MHIHSQFESTNENAGNLHVAVQSFTNPETYTRVYDNPYQLLVTIYSGCFFNTGPYV